jgi:hypothetical protein
LKDSQLNSNPLARGRERVQMHAYLIAAAYNLVRIARLAPACT